MNNNEIFKKQKLMMAAIVVLILTVSVMAYLLMKQKNVVDAPKAKSENLVSGATRMDSKEIWIDKIATEHNIQNQRIDSLQKSLEGVLKEQEAKSKQEAELNNAKANNSLNQIPSNAPIKTGNNEAQIDNSSEFLKTNNSNNAQSNPVVVPNQIRRIRKISIALTPKNMLPIKAISSFDNRIPSTAFAKGVLLGGVDASTSIQASSNPQPIILRIVDHGILPRKFRSDLKGCHVLAATYGDLSSERVNMRLEKLTCVERKTGEIIEMDVKGYVTGEDGRAGLRGTVVDRAGETMRNAAVGGFIGGMGSFLSTPQSPITFAANNSGLAQTNPLTNGEMLKHGASKGVSNALEKYADFYIKRAEQLQPVIQIQAGRVVDIVFTEGVDFGEGQTRAAIAKTNDKSRISQIKSIEASATPIEAWTSNQGSGS